MGRGGAPSKGQLEPDPHLGALDSKIDSLLSKFYCHGVPKKNSVFGRFALSGWGHKPGLLNRCLVNCEIGGCKETCANPSPTLLRQPCANPSPTFSANPSPSPSFRGPRHWFRNTGLRLLGLSDILQDHGKGG